MVTAESAVSPLPPRRFSSSMSKSHRSEGGEEKRGRVGRREKTEGSGKKEERTQDQMTKARRRREQKGTSNREDEEDDVAAPELSSDSQCTVITPVTSLPPPRDRWLGLSSNHIHLLASTPPQSGKKRFHDPEQQH